MIMIERTYKAADDQISFTAAKVNVRIMGMTDEGKLSLYIKAYAEPDRSPGINLHKSIEGNVDIDDSEGEIIQTLFLSPSTPPDTEQIGKLNRVFEPFGFKLAEDQTVTEHAGTVAR